MYSLAVLNYFATPHPWVGDAFFGVIIFGIAMSFFCAFSLWAEAHATLPMGGITVSSPVLITRFPQAGSA